MDTEKKAEGVGCPRIAVLGTRGFPGVQGGVEKHCENLYPRLVSLGCRVRVYARKGYVPSRNYSYRGVEIVPILAPKTKSLEAICHSLLGVFHIACNRKKFDVVHIHALGPSLVAPLVRLCGLKVVVTNHGPDYNRKKWGALAKAALRMGERLGTKYANGVIAVSKTIEKDLQTRYGRRVNYIPNGIDIPEPVPPGAYLDKLGLKPRGYFLAVARFVPEKGLHDLLRGFREIDTDWKLALVGGADHEDSYSAELKKMAAADARVVMTGVIKGGSLGEVYSSAGCFVLPSYHEGLPIVLLEALGYGLRVLCSSIPPNMEIVADEEALFPPGDIDRLKERMINAIKNGSEGREYFTLGNRKSGEFDWDSIAGRTATDVLAII